MDTATITPESRAHEERAARPRVSQWSVVRGEWIKLSSVRSNVAGLAAAPVGLLVLGLVFAEVGNSENGPRGTAKDALAVSFGGVTLSQLIIAVVAANFVASEYASGLMSIMFAAVGRRTRVLRAKAIVIGGSTCVVMTMGALIMCVAGNAVYSGDLPTYGLGDPGVLRAVAGLGLYGGCVALIGVAIGYLLRSTAASIGVLIGVLILGPLITGLLPGSVGTGLTKIMPSRAGDAIMSVSRPSDALSPWAALAVLAVWTVGLLTVASLRLVHRDA